MKSLAMSNFIFKSANRLIKNESVNLVDLMNELSIQFNLVKAEQRHSRSDLQDIKLMINKLLVDKHLQMQVDEYFTEDNNGSPDSS